ncbi:MAG: hypothetical protein GPJ54_03430 [Candidatus Heimdallarchaeota archaeon]|nr:hypothetical protein [Candidatus Heimdallarchaeota archaeon]
MSISETRGYVVGLNQLGQFTVPAKLMQKIVTTTGDSALLIWLPNERSLKIQPIESDNVTKLSIWFHTITQTLFDDLNFLFKKYDEFLIFKTGVIFPYHTKEKPSIEYYFKGDISSENNIVKIENAVKEFGEVASIEVQVLEKYIGD